MFYSDHIEIGTWCPDFDGQNRPILGLPMLLPIEQPYHDSHEN